MNAARRLVRELRQLSGILDTTDMARYLANIALAAPSILASHSLVSADRRMNGVIKVSFCDKSIIVPVDEITRLMGDLDLTPTFGAVREMYSGNVYLAPFGPDLKVETAVDLGSNRGLFSVLAAVALEARTVVGIEPSEFYEPVLEALLRANHLEQHCIHRISAFAASSQAPGRITLEEVMARYSMDRIGFLKCDIEGGEFDVLVNNNRFLDRVDHIAIELHPEHGEVDALILALESHGLGLKLTDQHLRQVGIEAAHYLYASRTWRVT